MRVDRVPLLRRSSAGNAGHSLLLRSSGTRREAAIPTLLHPIDRLAHQQRKIRQAAEVGGQAGMGEDPHALHVVVELLAWPACAPPARPRPAAGSDSPWRSRSRRRTRLRGAPAGRRTGSRAAPPPGPTPCWPARRTARRRPPATDRAAGPAARRARAARRSCTGPAACRAAASGRTSPSSNSPAGPSPAACSQLGDHRRARSSGTGGRGRAAPCSR